MQSFLCTFRRLAQT